MLGGQSLITTPPGTVLLRHAGFKEQVLSADENFEPANISVPSFSPFIRTTIGLARPGPRTVSWDIFCSPDQEFLNVSTGRYYWDTLKKGALLAPWQGLLSGRNEQGWAHGLAFGMGGTGEIDLGSHGRFLSRLRPFINPEKPLTPLKAILKPVCKWYKLPDDREDTLYWASFFRGWADSTGKDRRLVSTNLEGMTVFYHRCYLSGLVPTGEIIRHQVPFINEGIMSTVYRLWYTDLYGIKGFRVLDIQKIEDEPLMRTITKADPNGTVVLYPGIIAKADVGVTSV